MPSGYETYSIYVALKLHFSSKYDFHKFNGKTSATIKSFEKRKDRYFFEKLGNKYQTPKLIELFVSNFILNSNNWIGNLLQEEAEDNYQEWIKKTESLTYHFSEECDSLFSWMQKKKYHLDDLFHIKGNDHPMIVKMVLQKKISFETFAILNSIFKFGSKINKKIDDPIWTSLYIKMTKYFPFLNIDVAKYRLIVKRKIENEYPELKP